MRIRIQLSILIQIRIRIKVESWTRIRNLGAEQISKV